MYLGKSEDGGEMERVCPVVDWIHESGRESSQIDSQNSESLVILGYFYIAFSAKIRYTAEMIRST